MSENIFTSGLEVDERNDRARLAVKTFRFLQPSLTGYARAITGRKDVSVELATGIPRTDGTKIFYRPPIALGDPTPHQRRYCDKRDKDTLVQRCPACAVREEVLITIIHEISHIAFGTFEKPTDSAVIEAMDRAIEEAPNKAYEKAIREQWDSLPPGKKASYLGLSSLISPFLPVLVNCLEDARVDSAMFRARKGTRVMFDAVTRKIFREGIELNDGTFATWDTKPLNSQALIGVFVLCCGYDYAGWFAPEVEEALGDLDLQMLCGQVDTIRSSEGTYNIAFPILARLRELGFCISEKDPEEPEEEEEESDDEESPSDEEESDDEDGSDGDGDSSSDSDGDDDSDGEQGGQTAEPGIEEDTDSGSSAGGEESTDEGDEPQDDTSGRDDAGEGGGTGEPSQSDDEPASEEGDPSDDGAGSGSDDQPEGGPLDEPGDDGDAAHEGGDSGETEWDGKPERSDVSDRDAVDPDSDELIDTGADDGMGGDRVDTNPKYGDAETAFEDIFIFNKHEVYHGGEEPESTPEEKKDEASLDLAIMQGGYFETPSLNVAGVREHTYSTRDGDKHAEGWNNYTNPSYARYRKILGADADLSVGEDILGPALVQMRRAFQDNRRARMEKNRRSGKINTKSLGKRAPFADDRLFQKKRIPGKKSYAVLIGLDISGSTVGENIVRIKRAGLAQAELCHRTGVDFAIYAHTGDGGWGSDDLFMDIYEIKGFNQQWNDEAREALDRLCSASQNLDGHTIEYYRKTIERVDATDKIIMYYTDGKMPAENHDEELEILQREIRTCKAKGISLMGVGIRTDSPIRHGLDTVQVDSDEDLPKVVRHLETALLRRR